MRGDLTSLKVLKFGGTSVGAAEPMSRLMSIVEADAAASRVVVVVSALSGITNALEELVDATLRGHPYAERVERIVTRHTDLALSILPPDALSQYTQIVRIVMGRLELRVSEMQALRSVYSGSLSGPEERAADLDAVLSVGERLSAPMVSLALGTRGVPSTWVDSRHLILTDTSFGGAGVDQEATEHAIRTWHAALRPGVVPVVTGYIARSLCGRTTTLGRGGSDYTAAIVAEALSATKLDRWTDVNGIHTADPRCDPSAPRFAFLLAEDASTWNAAKALGMHEEAFGPVLRGCIPVHVRSTLHPHGDGTLILPRALPDRIGREAQQLRHRADQNRAEQNRAQPSSSF